ncbi:type II secretion system protein GspJ [Pseudophaeobacter arcticus]
MTQPRQIPMAEPQNSPPGSGTSAPGRPQPESGLSLIELVVAMALFALVAVMGTQALTGMMRMRDGLQGRAEQVAQLDRGLSLLRRDLRALVPMLFYPPERQPPQSALRFRNGVLSLSVAGQPRLQDLSAAAPPPLRFQRIDWELQGDVLQRRSWPALTPALRSSRQDAQAVMPGVTGLRLRSYWADLGWIDGAGSLGVSAGSPGGGPLDGDGGTAAAELYSSTLPLALELILETEDYGDISLVETLK